MIWTAWRSMFTLPPLSDFSYDLDGLTLEFFKKSAEEAAESDIPLLFISFPSAKDSTFNERYPGTTGHIAVA